MITILGIVIAVVLSAIVSVIIQQTGKNENSMEKVKRYANQRQAEFDEYFEKQTESIKLLANDLDTKDIQVKAAIKRMQMQIDECRQTTENFENPVQNIENIKNKIEAYDKVLQNLMEMTAAVEQNLDSVKKEALVVDKVNSRLSRQNQILEAVEKKVSDVTKQFSVKNSEQLKAIGSDLLNQYEQRASEIDATTEKAIKQNQAIMEKIEDDIRQAYSKAIENAKQLEDESFAKLKDESQKRTSACLDEVEAQTKQITAIIDSRISETQKSLDDKTKTFSDSLKEQTSAIEEKFNERTQRITEMIDARTNVLTGT